MSLGAKKKIVMNKIVQINALNLKKRVASVLLFGEFLQLGEFFSESEKNK